MATRYAADIDEYRARLKLKTLCLADKVIDKLDRKVDKEESVRALTGVLSTSLKHGMAVDNDEGSAEAYELSPGEAARMVARATSFLDAVKPGVFD